MLIKYHDKLLLQRPKNRPEMKASFLFNILGTIADNLRAGLNLLPYKKNKTKSIKLPFETKDSKHLVGTNGDDSSALIEFTPL